MSGRDDRGGGRGVKERVIPGVVQFEIKTLSASLVTITVLLGKLARGVAQKNVIPYMALMRPITRDLAIGGLVQFLAFLFAGCILDTGAWGNATADISVGFWVGVFIVLLRRHNALTEGDHKFLRFGLVPLLIVGIPITLGIWEYRGLV